MTGGTSTGDKVLIQHPALEIRSDLAVVGFRRRVVKEGAITEENVYFIVTESGIKVETANVVELPLGKVLFESKLLATDTADLQKLMEWCEKPSAPSPHELYENLKELLKCYLELPESSYGLIAAWIMGTYLYRAFPCYPYLQFLGPKETGKSNTLELLRNLCFNAVKTSLTLAALGDTADSMRGTIIVDQAHNFNDGLREILVDSYKMGGGKRRVVDLSNKGRKVLEFDCYCPKAFASHDPLPDDLADRTFTVNMAPASRAYPYPSASQRDWEGIRTSLVMMTLSSHRAVCDLVEEMSDEEGHRFGELWLPIRVVLTLAEAEAQIRARLDEGYHLPPG